MAPGAQTQLLATFTCNKGWVPHISFVFCEMWDSANGDY